MSDHAITVRMLEAAEALAALRFDDSKREQMLAVLEQEIGRYRDRVPDEDAAVVERLRDAGAVLVAKLTLGALASGDVWFAGRTRNPWNTDEGSSGSSAGSAVR